jgi:mRNA interferase RelE/StbE
MQTDLRETIKKALNELEESPEEKGERLKPSDFWRLRIGDYRAIYEIDRGSSKVKVLYIGHRKSVYDDFSRLV